MDRTDQQPQQPTPAQADSAPTPVDFHWVMTVQTEDGRQGTNDGRIGAVPGTHTRESTYSTVYKAMQDWMGTPHCAVVFYALTPNAIPAPDVTA